jgi:DNA-directed RNA polymerase subunit M/transcription elongation factor TFIIS
MPSHCPRCGSSLTTREAVENRCLYCSRLLATAPIAPRLVNSLDSLLLLRKNFDAMITEELRKRNLLPDCLKAPVRGSGSRF